MPCDLKGHWTDLNPFYRPLGGSQLFALHVNGKFKKLEIRNYEKACVCPMVKKVKMALHEQRNHTGGIEVQHLSLVISALDGRSVVSFTLRSLYSAGKRPCTD
jgi:hypothetical protein